MRCSICTTWMKVKEAESPTGNFKYYSCPDCGATCNTDGSDFVAGSIILGSDENG